MYNKEDKTSYGIVADFYLAFFWKLEGFASQDFMKVGRFHRKCAIFQAQIYLPWMYTNPLNSTVTRH